MAALLRDSRTFISFFDANGQTLLKLLKSSLTLQPKGEILRVIQRVKERNPAENEVKRSKRYNLARTISRLTLRNCALKLMGKRLKGCLIELC